MAIHGKLSIEMLNNCGYLITSADSPPPVLEALPELRNPAVWEAGGDPSGTGAGFEAEQAEPAKAALLAPAHRTVRPDWR